MLWVMFVRVVAHAQSSVTHNMLLLGFPAFAFAELMQKALDEMLE